MLNQDIHKNLRRNKHGVSLDEIGNLPTGYKRPPGFSVIPGLLAHQSKPRSSSYFEQVQEEMQG